MTVTAGLAERVVEHDGYVTSYLDSGGDNPTLLIHGSGPGVSARANWAGLLQSPLAGRRRFVAPDVAGFGATRTPGDVVPDHDGRVAHLVAFLDAMELDRIDLVGNSMGGALALALAVRVPDRIRRMVLMGTVGISFPISDGLDAVWGYEPSVENMENLIRLFAFDPSRVLTPELAQLRYEASLGSQDRYTAMFDAPRQRHVEEMALSEETLRSVTIPTLLVHGAQDRVIPLDATSRRLVELLPNADLVVFGRCGHWTQIERADDFQAVLDGFFSRP